MGYEVGRIIEVRGLSVKAKLNELLPPYLTKNGKRENSPKINGFVKTKVGLDAIICQVTGEYSEEINGKVSSHFLELQVRGNITNGRFIQGLRMLPIVSAKIETLDESDFSIIYRNDNNSISLGYDLFDESKKINIDINSLIPTHIGVFGNTGSGKSNTLVKILNEYCKIIKDNKTKRGKFVVFDINNEYSRNAICDEKDKEIYNLKTRTDTGDKIPISITDFAEDEFVVFMNASEKTQVPVIKTAYKNTFNKDSIKPEEYYLNSIRRMIKDGRKNLFLSMRHYLSDYFRGIDGFKYHTKNGEFFYQESSNSIKIYLSEPAFEDKLNDIKVKLPNNKLDRFLFELYFAVAYENENGIQIDFMMPLLSRANKLFSDFKKVFDFSEKKDLNKELFKGKNVSIVQLGNVNKDMKEIIPTIISEHIFNRLVETKENKENIIQVINIVIDEAHNILYDEKNQNSSHKNTLETFEKIVKEGRKFGCFLMLASQRPSDISSTIISQLHNYFIHKLVNPSDLSKIRSAVAYLDSYSLDFITVLAPGECVVSGTAFQMPTFLYVNRTEKTNWPNSENAKLLGEGGLFSLQKADDDLI
ncbi:MAG: ATP-binding protein [Erysipelotrichaceae bacterium]|nr:ATP-binding protein [Erysipelotrichaceae bacterium]